LGQWGDDQMRIMIILIGFLATLWAAAVTAQTPNDPLTIATVTRAPFSIETPNGPGGFSIDLMNAAAAEIGLSIQYQTYDSFGGMLAAVQSGDADAAIANISITAERERLMDFTQPIFDGGVQVMLRSDASAGGNILSVILTRELGLLVVGALLLLLAGGMLMYVFERRHQPYFDHAPKDAVFPAFWWALNLVVNGGFEERMPRSKAGRAFGVFLVIGSLFTVSIFVAQITAALTVNAIQDNVDSLSDLDGRAVGTIEESTTSVFLNERGIGHIDYPGLDELLVAFETSEIEAVVFDGPILAYYVDTTGLGKARLLDRIYRPEKYGVAFAAGSVYREAVDQAILRLREDGTYDGLTTKWFGAAYGNR
jgi:polar amino acid transport system substrate-binding protein